MSAVCKVLIVTFPLLAPLYKSLLFLKQVPQEGSSASKRSVPCQVGLKGYHCSHNQVKYYWQHHSCLVFSTFNCDTSNGNRFQIQNKIHVFIKMSQNILIAIFLNWILLPTNLCFMYMYEWNFSSFFEYMSTYSFEVFKEFLLILW